MFITGAGLSADSNLPTYRGVGGLYEEAATEDGISIEEALSGGVFRANPGLTWKYIGQIEAACRGAGPNRGHHVIAHMQSRFRRVVVLTQNVDGFHGDIHTLLCTQCGVRRWVKDFGGLRLPPRCPARGGIERPDVVLFDEMLPMNKVMRLEACLHDGFDLIFSIGTSSAFPYITRPIEEAARWGVPSVEINPSITPISHLVTHKLSSGAALTLDALWTGLAG